VRGEFDGPPGEANEPGAATHQYRNVSISLRLASVWWAQPAAAAGQAEAAGRASTRRLQEESRCRGAGLEVRRRCRAALSPSHLIPVMAYPRASVMLPFRQPTISMSPFRALILCLHPRRSFVRAVRPLARRAARAQASAEPTSVAPVCVSRTCCPSAARAAAAWTATDTAARSPAATRFRAAARPHAPSSTSAITKVRCPARGGRSAVSVGPPLSVQTSHRTLSPARGNNR